MPAVLRCIYTILYARNIREVTVAKSSVVAKVLDFFRATRQFGLEDQVMDFLDSWHLTSPG